MRQSMQRLVPADELLCHQIPETFATVSQADVSWTEKLWGSLFARDGSIQVDCGIGKYHNRNVIDMFAGISRGKEQLTVRASRQLDLDPERVGVGPLDFEVLEPLNQVRFVLGENDVLPIRFDLTVTGVLPPFLEAKDAQREPTGARISSDLLRYHQSSTVSGHIWIDGERIEVTDDEWFGFRDHSWGLRMDVGEPPADVHRINRLERDFTLTWSPMYLRRPDGTSYEIHHYLQTVDHETTYFSGFVNHPDGTQTPLQGLRDELKYDPVNRRLLGGKMTFDAGWGETRTVEVEPSATPASTSAPACTSGSRGSGTGSGRAPNTSTASGSRTSPTRRPPGRCTSSATV